MSNSRLYEHYMFWEWQYCYRNGLLRRCEFDFPGKDHIACGTNFKKYTTPHWSSRVIKKQIQDGIFDSKKILKNTLNKSLEYNRPRSHETTYHHVLYHKINDYKLGLLQYKKECSIPINFDGNIDIILNEIRLLYYQCVADSSEKNKKLFKKALENLRLSKIKNFMGMKTFREDELNQARALGLFVWDIAYDKMFQYGSREDGYKKANRIFAECQPDKESRCHESLKVLFEVTHEQILSREVKSMSK